MRLQRPGAWVNYEVWGDGDRHVVLINGHTRPLNDFRMLGRHLAERGFKILVLDNRGAGATEESGPFKLSDMVQDVLAAMDASKMGSAAVLGISMGGFIAQTMALTAPARVERLALVSTAGRQSAIRRDDTPWEGGVDKALAKLKPYFTDEFAHRNAALVKSMAKQIAANVLDGGFQCRAEAQRSAMAEFDALSQLGRLACPTLVIHGEEDRIVPVALGRELAGSVPAARLALIPKAGHLLLAEAPKDLYALVAEFFEG